MTHASMSHEGREECWSTNAVLINFYCSTYSTCLNEHTHREILEKFKRI